MRNFDEARAARAARSEDERRFTLGGEQFLLKPRVRPDAIMAAGSTAGKEPTEILAGVDEAIETCIEGGDAAIRKYRALRARTDDPLTLEDLLDVVGWIVEVQTGRPTPEPSGSSNGPTGGATQSTVVSFSPDTPPGTTA